MGLSSGQHRCRVGCHRSGVLVPVLVPVLVLVLVLLLVVLGACQRRRRVAWCGRCRRKI